jgi:YVTN family beta-propeller protein
MVGLTIWAWQKVARLRRECHAYGMTELPSGAVTFLFTDVEGSTALLKRLREHYAEGLAAHQRLLREAFERRGGRELDTQGDAFFYAFPRARDAVLAALDAQLALRAYDEWPEGAEFKVRMGVHTGQAEPSEGRYTGLAVHRAARICAAAHGGQVLVSQATETLLEDEEEDLQVSFRSLGQHRLKDLDRPVSLFQVETADLPRKFPPPREQVGLASWWRRPIVLVPAAGALAAIVGIAAVIALGSGGGGLSHVDPNNAGVIDAKTNKIVAQVPTGRRPGPIAAGSGAVWIGSLDDRLLTRVDLKSRTPSATIPLENRTPTGIAVSPGAVWVAHGLLGSVSKIDPQYNLVAKTINVAGRSDAGSIDVGGRALWAVFGNSTLARLTLTQGRVTRTGFAGSGPTGLVYAEDALWVANGDGSSVFRFNPATFETEQVATTNVGRQPSAIAYGEGSIWVTNSADGTVSRIDPASNATTTIPVGTRPSGVAVSSGAVWVANAGDGTISRIDPQSNTVVKTIEIGNRPAGLAVANGFVWVTVQAP